ncbi:MAG: hypothetical protein HFI24_05015 [Lachnospiraceae bacterium]|nr:hypothetical protein [Lachnospiraceae bacterium]MCI9624508.1 hypothetical protein [Lachnospiraceae bacterium]
MMKRCWFLAGVFMVLAFGMNVYGADAWQEGEQRVVEGDVLTKTVILPAGGVTAIPRYEVDGNVLYVLDEDSLSLRTVRTDSAEGAELVTVTKVIGGLPDNDLERIPMTEMEGDVSCELLYVSYKVTEESGEGMPLKYEALCWYGGLSKYKVDYDAAWEAVMTYTGHPIESSIQSPVVEYLYEYRNPPVVNGTGGGEAVRNVLPGQGTALAEGEGGQMEETGTEGTERVEDETVPMAAEDETGREPEEEPEGEQDFGQFDIEDEAVPLGLPGGAFAAGAAVVAVAGLLAAVLWYVFFHTAPIYTALYSGGYKRIGRIRLKYRKDHYVAVLSEFLTERAEIGKYKIKMSGYFRKRSRVGILDIECPDGRMITRKLKDVVLFSVIE